MRPFILLLISFATLIPQNILAQCSICTKNAQQIGPEAAAGLNAGILFMLLVPLVVMIIMAIYVIKKCSN